MSKHWTPEQLRRRNEILGKYTQEQLAYIAANVGPTLQKRDLYRFAQAAWPVIDPAPFIGGGFAMQAVCDHLQACADGHIRNLIINIPPRFSKSTLVGVLFPAWVWSQPDNSPVKGNGVQFLHASYSQNLALQDSLKCRRLVESDWYQQRFGDRVKLRSDQNTKSQFDLVSGGRRNTVSVGGSTTGMGGSYLIADDPNNAREANSEAILMSTLEWWDMAWSTRLNDPKTGVKILVQQRLNERDVTGHVLTKDIGNWTHLMLPMRFEPERRVYTCLVPPEETDDNEGIYWTDKREVEGELLWPERFGEDEVSVLERTLGPYGTAGQLQQRPAPAGGGIIKRLWWQPWDKAIFPTTSLNIGSLDLAYTSKKENDFSAMTCWGVFSDTGETTAIATRGINGEISTRYVKSDQGADVPKVILLDAWEERLEFHELINKIIQTARDSKLDIILVEDRGPGLSIAQEIRRLCGIEEFQVREVPPGDLDKVARMHSVVHLFAEGLIYAPCKPDDPDTFYNWAEKVVAHVEAFPKGAHDDIADTVSQAITFMRRNGMIERGSERTYELGERQKFNGNNVNVSLYPA